MLDFLFGSEEKRNTISVFHRGLFKWKGKKKDDFIQPQGTQKIIHPEQQAWHQLKLR